MSPTRACDPERGGNAGPYSGQYALRVLFLALAYCASGRFGLAFPYLGSNITLVWAPTGIAIAALLRCGLGHWPGVFGGALLVNFTMGMPLAPACQVAVGNTLGPLAVAWMLRRVGFQLHFGRRRDVAGYCAAVATGMMITATSGVSILSLAGMIPAVKLGSAWLGWWLGDAIGALLIGPLLLTASPRGIELIRTRKGEFVTSLLVAGGLAWFVFLRSQPGEAVGMAPAFLSIPVMVWAAMRLGPFAAALHALVLSGASVVATAMGKGPFYQLDLNAGLVLLGAFAFTTTVCGLLITALQSEGRQAEVALRESEGQLRRILETSPLAMLVFDRLQQVRMANRRFMELFGYSLEEVPDVEHWWPRAYPDSAYRDQVKHRWAERLAEAETTGGEFEPMEVEIQCRDGVRRYVEVRTSAVGEQTLVMFVDLTDRKRAEQALEANRSRMAGIVNSAMDGIITVDESHRVVVFNSAAESMFRISAAEAVGGFLERFIPARFRDTHGDHIRRFAATGVTTRAMGRFGEVNGLRADGKEFPMEASISQIFDGGQRLFTVTLRDVTEHKEAERQRTSLEAQLRQAQKMDAIGTLAGGIAHDFNNILGAILGNAEVGLMDVEDSHPTRASLEEILKASHRAKSLVQQILAFSRQTPPVRRVTSLQPLLDESLRLLRATLPAGVEILRSFDPRVPKVMADSTQIQQVIVNICTNAWQALEGEPGRIETILEPADVSTELAAAHPGLRAHPYALVRIRDSGKGMSPGVLERIFEPFFTTKGPGQGTGLGLAVVDGIMRSHDGVVVVRSQPGKGTEFALYLPAVDAEEGETNPMPHALASGQGQRILYVDDEEPLVGLAARMLERLGYRIHGFTKPLEAIEAFKTNPGSYDAVITDLNMPGLSGLQFAAAVQGLAPRCPVILSSGYVTEEIKLSALGLGIRRFIHKPNTMADLSEALASELAIAKPG